MLRGADVHGFFLHDAFREFRSIGNSISALEDILVVSTEMLSFGELSLEVTKRGSIHLVFVSVALLHNSEVTAFGLSVSGRRLSDSLQQECIVQSGISIMQEPRTA